MSKRHKLWAKAQRLRLYSILGNRCNGCGSETHLTFDCRSPAGDRHHKYDTSQRMCFYRAQFRIANLQLLCSQCNALKADFSLDIWCSAVNFALSQVAHLMPSCTPGHGTERIAALRHEQIAKFLASVQHINRTPSTE